MAEAPLDRTARLFGGEAMERLRAARVAVFGVGGVGGCCAESLARTGVGNLLIVDDDIVRPSNLNRQIVATTATLGRPKVEAFAERLAVAAPDCRVEARNERYCAETAADFDLGSFDVVIDAIDSVEDKALLVRSALSHPDVALFSSMGAARRTDPFQVRKSEFRKVESDGLARALRNRFRKSGGFPQRKFVCVWSAEPPRADGSVAHVTAVFGYALASFAVGAIVSGTVLRRGS